MTRPSTDRQGRPSSARPTPPRSAASASPTTFAGAAILPYGAFMPPRANCATTWNAAGRALRRQPRAGGAPAFDAAAAGPEGRAVLLRPGRQGRQHHQAPLGDQAAIRPLRFGLPLVERPQAFETPNRIIRQLAETPDGCAICASRPPSPSPAAAGAIRCNPMRWRSAARWRHAGELVYADDLDIARAEAFEPIGVSCRICERRECHQRAVPPLKRRLLVDPNRRKPVPYDLE
jgi:hypothetical protein